MTKTKKSVIHEGTDTFVFTKSNYRIMIIGLVVIFIGYLLMVGGNGDDPTKFYPEIFNFQRLTLAPIVILLGLGIEILAIFYKDKSRS